MTKPMWCPMSFLRTANSMFDWSYKPMECTPDCAWAVNNGFRYWCKIAETSEFDTGRTNTRPLKDDEE